MSGVTLAEPRPDRPNRIDWPPMPAMEDYLEARSEVEKSVARVGAYGRELAIFAAMLSKTPQEAIASIPVNWYSKDDIIRLLNDLQNAFDKMNSLWSRVPPAMQTHISKPIKSVSFYDPGR